jgi:hypothetical protein
MNGISDSTGMRDENPVPPYRSSAAYQLQRRAKRPKTSIRLGQRRFRPNQTPRKNKRFGIAGGKWRVASPEYRRSTMIRSSATKRFGRRQLLDLADSFPRLRPRPSDEKRSTPETRLVQVRILLPQPATRTYFSLRANGWIFARHFGRLPLVARQFERLLAGPFLGCRGHFGVFSPGALLALTQYDAAARKHLTKRRRSWSTIRRSIAMMI